MDYTVITEQLIIGSAFEPGDWHILAALGVGAVVNLRAEGRDKFPPGHRPHAALWLPIEDWTAPHLDVLMSGARFIKAMVEGGHTVYVHCFAGVGRAPTMAAAYLITTGMTAQNALVHVMEARPVASPNREQMISVVRFEKAWRSRKK